ncbi:MAG: FtsX-like permease family protein [Chitinophagaceae bacterium]
MTSLFAWRYFKAKKSTNAINVIAWISVVAIAVVTAALIVVLSVFNGFEGLVKSLYNDFYSNMKVLPVSGKTIQFSPAQARQLQQISGISFIQPVVEEKAILINDEYRASVTLKGVEATYENASGLPKHIIRGHFETGTEQEPAIVLGAGVENALGVLAGTSPFPITIYVPNRKATSYTDPLEALQSRNAAATGTFVVQQEFDNGYAFTNLAFMRDLLQLDSNQYSSIEIFTKNEEQADKIQAQVQQLFGKEYKVQNRYQLNQNLYAAMQVEKVIIYGVAFLILLIAAFNIVGSLSMLVLEKQKDIAVLQAIGASRGWIQSVFLKEGLLLAVLGGAAGIIIAIAICLGQSAFHWVKLGGNSFIIDYYPVEMHLFDFVLIAMIIIVIGFLAAFVPSRKAERTFVSLKS